MKFINIKYKSLINTDQCDLFTNIPKDVDECKNKLSEEQIKDDLKKYCCYSKIDNDLNPSCISLTETQYDNIKDYIKFSEILWGEVNLNINCNSFYLRFWIFNLILYILLFK